MDNSVQDPFFKRVILQHKKLKQHYLSENYCGSREHCLVHLCVRLYLNSSCYLKATGSKSSYYILPHSGSQAFHSISLVGQYSAVQHQVSKIVPNKLLMPP